MIGIRVTLLTAAIGIASAQGIAADTPPVTGAPQALPRIQELVVVGSYAEAERAARAALAAIDARGSGESIAAADLLDQIVGCLYKSGKERGGDARQLAERALGLRERLQGCDHPDTAGSAVGLADVLRRNADFAAARPLYERALDVRERTFGSEAAEVAESLHGLANLHFDTGDYAGAKRLLERALTIRTRVFGPGSPEVADTQVNLGSVARNTGDYPGARSLFERVLAIRETVLGPDHVSVAAVLNNLALTLKGGGDYPGARRCYERALAIWERAYGPGHPYVAGALNNLANVAHRTGDYAAARPLLERSLAIREKTLGPSHPEVAQSLTNLAILLRDAGDLKNARALLERALTIRENAQGPTHREVATTLANLGDVVADGGDLAGARAIYERALAIRERALGPQHPLVAESLHALAVVLARMGDTDAARPMTERALAIWTQSFGPDHPEVGGAMVTLAGLMARSGDREGALTAALRGEEIGRNHLRLTAHLLSEHEALGFAAIRTSGRDLALSLAARTDASTAQRRAVWEAVAASRNVVFDAVMERRRELALSATDEVAALREELHRASDELARMLVRGTGDQAPERARALLDAARQREERAESALAERSGEFRAHIERLTLDEVASSLPTGSALVSFVRYRHDGAAGPPPVPFSGSAGANKKRAAGDDEDAYLAMVLRAGNGAVALVPIGPAREVDPLIARWAEEASRGVLVPGRSPAATLAAYREAGRALRRRVWDPLAPHLRGATGAYLVPDGALHLVSWPALPVGRADYLVESGPVLHLLTSEKDVLVEARADRIGSGLLALGGPAFDSRTALESSTPSRPTPGVEPTGEAASLRAVSPCSGLGDVRFEALPSASLEVEEIAAIWRAASVGRRPAGADRLDPASDQSGGVLLLEGEAATEAAFKAASRGRQVVHLATHGFFLGGDCPGTARATRGIGGLAAREPGTPAAGGVERPVVSGLALAGANERRTASRDQEDGVLTSAEIATLDLSGVGWAVLSACDTGVGRLHGSEGVLGLQRAFRTAGVRTVIMSLWGVDDRAAREWMAALYRARLLEDMSTAAAVRAASRRVLDARRARSLSSHPFYWGAFVASGDWR